jgi:hypothetical protein
MEQTEAQRKDTGATGDELARFTRKAGAEISLLAQRLTELWLAMEGGARSAEATVRIARERR